MIVDPALFAETMEAKFKFYGNVTSPALRGAWARMAEIFNTELTRDDGGARPVIPAELGAGKTTAAKVWCALHPFETHPGVLVVVRLIEQAKEFAADVNAWSGVPNMAFAYHSDLDDATKANLDALAQYPVLVICHRGYGMALDSLSLIDYSGRFDAVHRYRHDRRSLVIVDEALEQIHEARLSRADLAYARAKIPMVTAKAHLGAIDVLGSIERALLVAPDDQERDLTVEEMLARAGVDAKEADALLVALWKDLRVSRRIRPDNRAFVREALEAVRHHLAAHRWTAPGGVHGPEAAAVIGGKLLMPPEAALVVLDATGDLNNVYRACPEFYQVRTDIERVRDYRNVTLYVTRTRQTGLVAMRKQGERIARETLDAVLAKYGDQARERRVLVVTNPGSEDTVRSVWGAAPFAEVQVAHWYDLDGRNEWSEFDTLVTLTLPYGSPSFDLTTFLLTHRTHLGDAPPAEVRAMREVRMAALVAQAIGRIRLRRVTSEDGSCAPCDVFLRMPNWDRVVNTDSILGHLRRALAGARVEDWRSKAKTSKVPVRHRDAETAIREAALRLGPGDAVPLSDVCPGVGRSTLYRAADRALVGTGAVVRGGRLELGLEARARALPAGITVKDASRVLRVTHRRAARLLGRA